MATKVPERVLGLVFKAALAVIMTTYAYNAAAPVVARMRRKRELKRELRNIERELERKVSMETRAEQQDRMFAAMDQARKAVGLKPYGGN